MISKKNAQSMIRSMLLLILISLSYSRLSWPKFRRMTTTANTENSLSQTFPQAINLGSDGGYALVFESAALSSDGTSQISLLKFTAAGEEDGEETMVNTFVEGQNVYQPRAKQCGTNIYFVAWATASRDIYAMAKDASNDVVIFEETKINPTTVLETRTDYVEFGLVCTETLYYVIWADNNGSNTFIYGRKATVTYDGVTATSVFDDRVQVNLSSGDMSYLFKYPSFYAINDGGFLALWYFTIATNSSYVYIKGMRFDSAFTKIGSNDIEFSSSGTIDPSTNVLALLDNNTYVMVYLNSFKNKILGKIYTNFIAGSILTFVTDYTVTMKNPAVMSHPLGFLLTYISSSTDTAGHNVVSKLFDFAGAAISTVAVVTYTNVTTEYDLEYTCPLKLSQKTYAVFWSEEKAVGDFDIMTSGALDITPAPLCESFSPLELTTTTAATLDFSDYVTPDPYVDSSEIKVKITTQPAHGTIKISSSGDPALNTEYYSLNELNYEPTSNGVDVLSFIVRNPVEIESTSCTVTVTVKVNSLCYNTCATCDVTGDETNHKCATCSVSPATLYKLVNGDITLCLAQDNTLDTAGYYFDTDKFSLCSEAMTNCITCTTSDACTSCDVGFTPDQETNLCVNCYGSCEECTGEGTETDYKCASCKVDYYPLGTDNSQCYLEDDVTSGTEEYYFDTDKFSLCSEAMTNCITCYSHPLQIESE